MQDLTQRRGGAEGWAHAGVLSASANVLFSVARFPPRDPSLTALASYGTRFAASPVWFFETQLWRAKLPFLRLRRGVSRRVEPSGANRSAAEMPKANRLHEVQPGGQARLSLAKPVPLSGSLVPTILFLRPGTISAWEKSAVFTFTLKNISRIADKWLLAPQKARLTRVAAKLNFRLYFRTRLAEWVLPTHSFWSLEITILPNTP